MPPFSSQSALPLPRGWWKITRVAAAVYALLEANTLPEALELSRKKFTAGGGKTRGDKDWAKLYYGYALHALEAAGVIETDGDKITVLK